MTTPDVDLRAVPQIPAPDLSACGLFERGHHAHPVQVSLALKNVGYDGRFRTVVLTAADPVDVDGRMVVRLRLRPVASADPSASAEAPASAEASGSLEFAGHDPALALALARIEHPVFVWEEQYGVLFVMTEQDRDVLGTGAVTLAAAETLRPCRLEP